MDSKDIMKELRLIWKKYRAGLITLEEARAEQSLLKDMLGMYQAVELEEKIQALEAAMEMSKRGWR